MTPAPLPICNAMTFIKNESNNTVQYDVKQYADGKRCTEKNYVGYYSAGIVFSQECIWMCLTLTDIVVLRSSYAADSPSVEEASIYKNWKKTSSDLWIRSVSDWDLVLRFFWTFLIPNGVWCVEFYDDPVYHQLFHMDRVANLQNKIKKK